MVNPDRHAHIKVDLAKKFMDYLVSEQGRRLITGFKVNDEQLFYVAN
jgi:tungstate transport system substrate-binding protein